MFLASLRVSFKKKKEEEKEEKKKKKKKRIRPMILPRFVSPLRRRGKQNKTKQNKNVDAKNRTT